MWWSFLWVPVGLVGTISFGSVLDSLPREGGGCRLAFRYMCGHQSSSSGRKPQGLRQALLPDERPDSRCGGATRPSVHVLHRATHEACLKVQKKRLPLLDVFQSSNNDGSRYHSTLGEEKCVPPIYAQRAKKMRRGLFWQGSSLPTCCRSIRFF